MSRKKKGSKATKKAVKTYGERILALVGKSWMPTGKIIGKLDCPPRAARRVLRGLVKARQLKSAKVQRERFFAAPGTKAAPPKAESNSGNGKRTRPSRSKSKRTAKGGKKNNGKGKRRGAHVRNPVKRSHSTRTAAAPKSARTVKRVRKPSGAAGTQQSAPNLGTAPTAAVTSPASPTGPADNLLS